MTLDARLMRAALSVVAVLVCLPVLACRSSDADSQESGSWPLVRRDGGHQVTPEEFVNIVKNSTSFHPDPGGFRVENLKPITERGVRVGALGRLHWSDDAQVSLQRRCGPVPALLVRSGITGVLVMVRGPGEPMFTQGEDGEWCETD